MMNPAIAKRVGINLDIIMPFKGRDNKSATLTTRDGHPIRKFNTQFREPVFKNGYVPGTRNSIEFQNAGSTTAIINGNWTILAGGSKKFDGSNEVDVNTDRFTVYFPSDPFNGGGLNRLEICEIILSDMVVAHFRDSGIEAYNE